MVHPGVSAFGSFHVTIVKGTGLLLVDDGPYLHILRNGQWQQATARPAREAGAPSTQECLVNGRSVVIGPFLTAGVFHLYCTIHAGINLTVVVQG